MFIPGQIYNRRHLHQLYGGQQQSGISTPSQHNLIMLFTGEQGSQYGYQDNWTDDGVFLYTGQGQTGDMIFMRGNRAVRDHAADGKDLYLFEYVQPGQVRYMGQMVCTGFQYRQAPDREGNERRVITFELASISAFDTTEPVETTEQELWATPLSDLRQRALATSVVARGPSERKQQSYYRSSAIRTYVMRRADGHCEGCGQEAPFRTSAGRPYLEPHHLRRLSDGGPDHPNWIAALCPNCHSRAHHSADRIAFNEQLIRIVREKERHVSPR
ncbi:MAG: HNH endonuclease [Chloroflexi bacterium]|nr:HNH endonuclease [Chloroflexota bacterium]